MYIKVCVNLARKDLERGISFENYGGV
jgi:hypothetical protein